MEIHVLMPGYTYEQAQELALAIREIASARFHMQGVVIRVAEPVQDQNYEPLDEWQLAQIDEDQFFS